MTALLGARVVNTRARRQAAELDAALKAQGAEPVAFPCVEIAPPNDIAPFLAAIDRLNDGVYDWLVLTSANAAEAVASALASKAVSGKARIAAVGPGTAAAVVDAFGVVPDVIPPVHDAAGLVAALPIRSGERVMAPGSSLARAELASSLRARGVEVDAVVAYETVIGSGGANVAALIGSGEIDAIAFASPSAVDGFLTRLDKPGSPNRRARGLPVGCIGETTADHAAARGFRLIAIADRPTVEGLVDSLVTALASSRKGAAA